MDCTIPGMESVIATVSGYHGSERFNLIKLITQAGASYVGAMSKSATHLVCWKFEGRKYDLAKKFKTIIVNHQWVEDCIKQGKRVPENPYIATSGKEVGPLLLEVPIIDNFGFSNKNCKALSDKSNISDNSEKQMGCGDSDLATWTDSFLLNQNLFSEVQEKKVYAHKLKPKRVKKTSKQEQQSSSRCYFQDPPPGLIRLEDGDSSPDSSSHSVREKRKISRNEESSTCSNRHLVRGKRKITDFIEISAFGKPSPREQRLLKKKVARDNVETVLSDSDLECQPFRLHNKNSKAAAPTNCTYGEGNVAIYETGGTSDALNTNRGSTNDAFDDVEETVDCNHLPASADSNSSPKDALTALERPDQCSNVENLGGKSKDVDESFNRLSTSIELSCVICWTEFSSTRGVLPCGHRFCYSCIQNWADHMASRRKISTCPLCKASFVSITKLEDAATSDQKIYSQTIPCVQSTTDVFILSDQESQRYGAEPSLAQVCSVCRRQEPEDLLISCHLCQIRCVHSYCLDPPLLPWTCIHCKDLQMLYSHTH